MHGAADALGLTQSAVSKRIQALERRTGVVLLERGRHGVRPERGRAAAVPRGQAGARRAAPGGGGRRRGQRGGPPRAAPGGQPHDRRVPAPRLARRLPHRGARRPPARPGRRRQLARGSSSSCAAARRRSASWRAIDPLAGFEAITLMRDELVVVVAAGHRWARRRGLRAAELAQEPYLARERDSGTRAVAAAALGAHGIALEPALETPSIQGLKRAVLSGGFTVISSATVQAEVASGVAACRERSRRRARPRAARRPPARAGAVGCRAAALAVAGAAPGGRCARGCRPVIRKGIGSSLRDDP